MKFLEPFVIIGEFKEQRSHVFSDGTAAILPAKQHRRLGSTTEKNVRNRTEAIGNCSSNKWTSTTASEKRITTSEKINLSLKFLCHTEISFIGLEPFGKSTAS